MSVSSAETSTPYPYGAAPAIEAVPRCRAKSFAQAVSVEVPVRAISKH